MKLLLVALVLILALSAVQSAPRTKPQKNSGNGTSVQVTTGQVAPQWGCAKVNSVNSDAHDDGADGTKCQYLEYIRQELINNYKPPTYPSCYAQLDMYCQSDIANYKERSNIRVFSKRLELECQKGGHWDDFNKVLAKFQEQYPEAFTTAYWQCIKGKSTEYEEQNYVPLPTWPAPYLDVLNYVCQSQIAVMRNAERIQLQTFFDNEGSFKTLSNLGRKLFVEIKSKVEAADLSEEIKNCYAAELGFFASAAFPEVEGTYNTKETAEDEYDQAYLAVEEKNDNVDGGAPYTDGHGYECWNYYAPQQHFTSSTVNVAEDAFTGNKGHPLCPDNSIYEPLSYYGPICCPIHPIDKRPKTYNCCFESYDLPQMRKSRRRLIPMRSSAACYGCSCLQGYSMDVQKDFWEDEFAYGGCVADTEGGEEEQ